MKLTVVAPTFNEAENVPKLVRELEKVLAGIDYEIIIADDNSPDRTWAVAEEIGRRDARVRVVCRHETRSLGWSVIEGFTVARGEVLACIDADLQHDPALLPRMLEELNRGYDLVVGSRYVPGGSLGRWQWCRRFESSVATKLAQWIIGIRIYDPLSGYFLLRRSDFQRVRDRLNGKGFKILLELASQMKTRNICEVPYKFGERTAGKSKVSANVVLAYLVQLWRLRS